MLYYYQPGKDKKCEYCNEIFYHTHEIEDLRVHELNCRGCIGIYIKGDSLSGQCTCIPRVL